MDEQGTFKIIDKLWGVITDHMALLEFGEVNDSNREKCARPLRKLVDLGKIDKVKIGKGFLYRKKGLTSRGEHFLAVTDVLVDILITYPKTQIFREYPIGKSRCDAALLVNVGNRTMPLILEVALRESLDSILGKLVDYRAQDDFFGYPSVGVLVIGDLSLDEEGVIVTDRFRRELCESVL